MKRHARMHTLLTCLHVFVLACCLICVCRVSVHWTLMAYMLACMLVHVAYEEMQMSMDILKAVPQDLLDNPNKLKADAKVKIAKQSGMCSQTRVHTCKHTSTAPVCSRITHVPLWKLPRASHVRGSLTGS